MKCRVIIRTEGTGVSAVFEGASSMECLLKMLQQRNPVVNLLSKAPLHALVISVEPIGEEVLLPSGLNPELRTGRKAA